MPPPPKLPTKATRPKKLHLHRLSGVWVFLVDNAFFGATLATAGLALPISCTLAFFAGTTGVFLIETLVNRDGKGRAFNKALLAGILSGIPTSIGGTIYGAWVMRMAGMSKKDIPIEEPPIDVQSSTSQDESSSSH